MKRAPKSEIGFDEWQAALHALTEVETVPDGWLTTQAFAEKRGLSRPRAGVLLRQLYDKQLVERRMFRIHFGSRVGPVPHYRPKPRKA